MSSSIVFSALVGLAAGLLAKTPSQFIAYLSVAIAAILLFRAVS